MNRLIVVYNPNSTNYKTVMKKVLAETRKLKGWSVGKFEVKKIEIRENIERLRKILKDGDLVVTAGGDGTAAVGLNAIMLAKKKATYAVLGFGNFNDVAATFRLKSLRQIIEKFEKGEVEKMWPIEILVDGRNWRYATGYFTAGMFAEATEIFNKRKIRTKLKRKKSTPIFSWFSLAKWYFLNRRKRKFLPRMKINGQEIRKATDYVAVNGRKMGGALRGGDWFLRKNEFRSFRGNMKNPFNLFLFMTKGIIHKVSGKETKKDVLEFLDPAEVEIHAEGEYEKLEGVKRIDVKKAERAVLIVRG